MAGLFGDHFQLDDSDELVVQHRHLLHALDAFQDIHQKAFHQKVKNGGKIKQGIYQSSTFYGFISPKF